LVNSLLLGYTTILTTEEMLSVWPTPCPVLGDRTVNTSAIIEGVFYAWSMLKVYRGQQRSFTNSRS
jgi:hypothetical protein